MGGGGDQPGRVVSAAASGAGVNETARSLVIANHAVDRPSEDPDDDLAVLARQYLRALEGRDWRPLKVWPCPKGEVVLFWGEGRLETGSYTSDGVDLLWSGRRVQKYDAQPTHWLPLPSPPEVKK